MTSILHLPKWFPNRFDEQNGIFVKKQIESVGKPFQHIVLTVYKDEDISRFVERFEHTDNNILFVDICYKPKQWNVLNGVLHLTLLFWFGLKYAKNCQIIHSHVFGRNALIGLFISKLKGLVHFHSEHWSLLLRPELLKQKSKLYQKLMAFLFRKVELVLPVSHALEKAIINIEPKVKTQIVGNVIELNTFKNSSKNEKFTFVVVADLRDDIKNISGIIQAFLQLEANGISNIQLDIVGHGPDYDMLFERGSESNHIHFLGRQTNKEVYKVMNTSHCLIMNSKVETFGMVVLEAFSCGLPVICAKNGVTELFVNHNTGIIVDSQNTLEIAMQNMMTSYSNFEKESIIQASKSYSKQNIGEALTSLYKQSFYDH